MIRLDLKKHGAILLIVVAVLLALTTGLVTAVQNSDSEEHVFDPPGFAQTRQPLTPTVDNSPHGQIAVNYIKYLNDNFYDRFAFTQKEMQTAVWLVEELLAMGYTWDDIQVQEFTIGYARRLTDLAFMMDLLLFIDHSPFVNIGVRQSQTSQNVILTVPGRSDEVIVVGAHYDSVMFPGASDNASGVALLLESAQRMQSIDNYYTIVYVFFGAEEVGLFGAYYFVHRLTQEDHDNLLFMINADILLDGDELFYMAGYNANGRPGANHITETWDHIAQELGSLHGFDLMPLPWGVFGPSDQLAFLPHGHTAMFLAGLTTETIGYIPDGDINFYLLEMGRVLHTPMDDFYFIIETWPDKMERNMREFSVFLEEVLLAVYSPYN